MPLADLSLLDKHKKDGFLPGYPAAVKTFFSPVPEAMLSATAGAAA